MNGPMGRVAGMETWERGRWGSSRRGWGRSKVDAGRAGTAGIEMAELICDGMMAAATWGQSHKEMGKSGSWLAGERGWYAIERVIKIAARQGRGGRNCNVCSGGHYTTPRSQLRQLSAQPAPLVHLEYFK